MELRESESLGIFDNHDGGFRDIYTDFYDSCRHQYRQFSRFKILHDLFFFTGSHPSMKESDLSSELRK